MHFLGHTIGVEAIDQNGEPGGRTAQATIVINVVDVNDQPPIFLKKKYQGFMNGDLTKLRNDLQVEATDLDQKGSKNSQIRYEIIKGNYDKKFNIDEVTGVITVSEPLTNDVRSQRRFSRQNGIDDEEFRKSTKRTLFRKKYETISKFCLIDNEVHTDNN